MQLQDQLLRMGYVGCVCVCVCVCVHILSPPPPPPPQSHFTVNSSGVYTVLIESVSEKKLNDKVKLTCQSWEEEEGTGGEGEGDEGRRGEGRGGEGEGGGGGGERGWVGVLSSFYCFLYSRFGDEELLWLPECY